MKTRGHHELESWQRAREFVSVIYELTRKFPQDERFGLTAQLRRASISIPSNIAEGAARSTTSDYIRFLYMARGSLSEIETQLFAAEDLDYLTPSEAAPIHDDLDSLAELLQAQINSLHARNS